jgi:predicted O-methyltransferase YrrM
MIGGAPVDLARIARACVSVRPPSDFDFRDAMTAVIDEIYARNAVKTADGRDIPLRAAISREEGELIRSIIAGDPSVTRTLEVGCANGLSSLYICDALKGRPGAHHVIIDPFQKTEWHSAGINNLARAGIDFFDLVEEKSEFALPRILSYGEGQFDFIFVDGWHTFDHTLLDCFYAQRLLKVGGYLVIDDVSWPSVSRAVAYVENYPHMTRQDAMVWNGDGLLKKALVRLLLPLARAPFRQALPLRVQWLLNRLHSVVALRKIAPDTRTHHWYDSRF